MSEKQICASIGWQNDKSKGLRAVVAFKPLLYCVVIVFVSPFLKAQTIKHDKSIAQMRRGIIRNGVDYMENEKEQIRSQITAIAKRVNYADAAFEAYFQLTYGPEKYNQVLALAGGFFGVARKALYDSAIIQVCEVFKRLEHFMEHSITIRDDDSWCEPIEDASARLMEQRPIIEKLKTVRNKLLAHIDREWVLKPNELYDDNLVAEHDIREVIRNERTVCCAVMGMKAFARYINLDDTTALLIFCSRHLEEA